MEEVEAVFIPLILMIGLVGLALMLTLILAFIIDWYK